MFSIVSNAAGNVARRTINSLPSFSKVAESRLGGQTLFRLLPTLSFQYGIGGTTKSTTTFTPVRSLHTSPLQYDSVTTNSATALRTIQEEISGKINSILSLYREGLKILCPNYDPHSGPVCLQGSTLLAALLGNLGGLGNIQIKASFSGSLCSVHQHVFIVCSLGGKEELIIDPSYQQFLKENKNSESNTLPSVFVGTRKELYEKIYYQLGPDKRTYSQKLLGMLGLDESPISGPQVIEANYQYASQEIPWGKELSKALDMLKQGKSASEVAEYCYNTMTISTDYSTINSSPTIRKGFFGDTDTLKKFFTWAQDTLQDTLKE